MNPWTRLGVGEVPKPLIVAIAVEKPHLLRWHSDIVRSLDQSGLGKVTQVIVVGNAGSRHKRPLLGRPTALATEPITTVPGSEIHFLESVTEFAPSLAQVDVLIDLTSSHLLDSRLTPPKGLWAFRFGGMSSDPSAAVTHAIAAGMNTMAVELHRVDGQEEVVLRHGVISVDSHSYVGSLDRLLLTASEFPVHACRDALLGGKPPIPPLALPEAGTIDDSPQLLPLLTRIAVSKLRRFLYGAFVLKHWAIGRVQKGVEGLFSTNLGKTTWIAPDRVRTFLADPMVLPGSDGNVVLCEALDYADGLGEIVRLQLRDGQLVDEQVVLADDQIHFSYPGLVPLDDGWLCVPEAGMTGDLRGYLLSQGLEEVIGEEVLLEGLPAIDPTIFRHGERWWLLCTESGWTALSHLWLYHAESPLGPWTPHPKNPVLIDVRAARPAGPPFLHHGCLYRPSQDCSTGYGSGVTLTMVTELTPTNFEEEYVTTIRPDPSGERPDGLHTVSVDGNILVIDGYRDRIHPLAGLYRWRAHRKTSKLAPWFANVRAAYDAES